MGELFDAVVGVGELSLKGCVGEILTAIVGAAGLSGADAGVGVGKGGCMNPYETNAASHQSRQLP